MKLCHGHRISNPDLKGLERPFTLMASHFEDRGLVAVPHGCPHIHMLTDALEQITGANGTIGYASVVHALETGYRVRCILRRESAVETIRSGPSLQRFSDKVEYAIVLDNTVPNAYDSALAGAKYVVHIAGVWPKPVHTLILSLHVSRRLIRSRTITPTTRSTSRLLDLWITYYQLQKNQEQYEG
jgi:hypothetical protein